MMIATEHLDIKYRNRIAAFDQHYEKEYFYWLAYHAAFPVALTSDLLFKIWLNFKTDAEGRELNIPLYAVADLLASPLVRKIETDLYEIPRPIRLVLLDQLRTQFGPQRVKRLARFLLVYLDLNPSQIPSKIFEEAQRFLAESELNPQVAAQKLIHILNASSEKKEYDRALKRHLTWTGAEEWTGEEKEEEGDEIQDSSLQIAVTLVKGLKEFQYGEREKAMDLLNRIKPYLKKESVYEKDGLKVKVSDSVLSELGPIAALSVEQIIEEARKSASTELDLSGKDLSEIPQELEILDSLEVLKLQNNNLENIPAFLTRLPNLRELYVDDNLLTDIPQILPHPALQVLSLKNNRIKNISNEILQKGRQISSLLLSGNPIEDEQIILSASEGVPALLKYLDSKGFVLPEEESSSTLIQREASYRYAPQQLTNQDLIESIAQAISDYNVSIKNIFEEARQSEGRNPRMRDLRVAVIDAFPSPIAGYLRKWFLNDTISRQRIQSALRIYQITIQYLNSILLSELRLLREKKEEFELNQPEISLILSFFNKTEDYNKFTVFTSLLNIFKDQDTVLFIQELQELNDHLKRGAHFREACLFLEAMEREFEQNGIPDFEVESFCYQTEQQLAVFLQHLGFIVKYPLVSVKTIEVLANRFSSPRFQHNVVVQNRLTASFGVLDDTIVSENFCANNSVVLFKNEAEVEPYLNLHPFIIDENAHAGKLNSKLYFFQKRIENRHVYQLIDNLNEPLLEVRQGLYPNILEDMGTSMFLITRDTDFLVNEEFRNLFEE